MYWQAECTGLTGNNMWNKMLAVRDAHADATNQNTPAAVEAQWTAMVAAVEVLQAAITGPGSWRMQVHGSTDPSSRHISIFVEKTT